MVKAERSLRYAKMASRMLRFNSSEGWNEVSGDPKRIVNNVGGVHGEAIVTICT